MNEVILSPCHINLAKMNLAYGGSGPLLMLSDSVLNFGMKTSCDVK